MTMKQNSTLYPKYVNPCVFLKALITLASVNSLTFKQNGISLFIEINYTTKVIKTFRNRKEKKILLN